MLQTYDWTTILRSEDPNICMGGLYKILNEGLDTIAPQVEKRISYRKRICDPWVTPALRISFTNISKLCKSVCLLDKTDPKYLEYKTKRNCLTKLKRLMRIKHYKSKLLEFRNDSKKLWSSINQISHRTKDKSSLISYISIDGIDYYNSKDISDRFCKYFSTIGSKLA